MTEHEHYVQDTLAAIREDIAALTERTSDYAELRKDVSDIKGRTRLLEFKASAAGTIAGTAAGAIFAGVKAWFGRNA